MENTAFENGMLLFGSLCLIFGYLVLTSKSFRHLMHNTYWKDNPKNEREKRSLYYYYRYGMGIYAIAIGLIILFFFLS